MTAQTRRLRPPHSRGAGFLLAAFIPTALVALVLLQGGLPAPALAADNELPAPVSAGGESPASVEADGLSLSTDAEACDARADQAPPAAQLPLSAATWVGDWTHGIQVVNWLRYRTPRRRVVYLLGGSASRESIISEANWSQQLAAISGKATSAWVLSSKCQSFEEDRRLVTALPKQRGVVVINVGLSRFLTAHKPSTVSRTSVRTQPPGGWYQHHYDLRFPLSLAVQRGLVRDWVRDRSRLFAPRYPAKLADLERVVEACLSRGMHPVLLDMPLNVVAVGHAFDEARAMYREGCMALAEEQGIPYLRFGSSIGLHANDFFDLWHLLPSGRAKWQSKLSRLLVSKQLL